MKDSYMKAHAGHREIKTLNHYIRQNPCSQELTTFKETYSHPHCTGRSFCLSDIPTITPTRTMYLKTTSEQGHLGGSVGQVPDS